VTLVAKENLGISTWSLIPSRLNALPDLPAEVRVAPLTSVLLLLPMLSIAVVPLASSNFQWAMAPEGIKETVMNEVAAEYADQLFWSSWYRTCQ